MTSAPLTRRPNRRKLALAAGALLLAAGVFLGLRACTGGPDPNVRTITVERGSIENTVTAVGALQPKEYVDVGTQVSGQLERVHVRIGERVKKGALIAEIDPTRYESTVRNDRATLDSLQAQLNQQLAEAELARQQLERNRGLFASRAVSKGTVEESEAGAKVAQARVAATRAQIKANQATLEGNLANLGYTKIYAPMDGTVISQTTLEGQTVNASQSAPVIVRIANLDVMTVWAKVAEADVVKIKPGAPAYFSTLGMPDRRWHGEVRQIQPTPESVNDVVLFNVLIDVDNREQLLLPSMTVQTFFVLGHARDVPIVPLSALKAETGRGGKSYTARVEGEDGIEERKVTLGLTNRTAAEVVSGLKAGDKVVLPAAPAAEQKNGDSGRVPRRMGGGGPRI